MKCWLPSFLTLALVTGCSSGGTSSGEPSPAEAQGASAQAAAPWKVCGRTPVSLGMVPRDSVDESRAMSHLEAGLLFAADDGVSGSELWLTTGTQGAGTRLLKDIAPGAPGSAPLELTRVGNRVFFAANDPVYGRELFVSDGTPGGTRLVKDIWPGDTGSFPRSLAEYNGLLYFSAGDPDHGRELWRSDGTAAGTYLVDDLELGFEGSSPGQLTRGADGALYFIAQLREGLFTALMRSADGSPGALEVFRIPSERGIQAPLVSLGKRLFFIAGAGHEDTVKLMATSRGAPAVRVAEFGEVHAMAAVGGKLLLSATSGHMSEDAELWVSDGTLQGTRRLKDLRMDHEGSMPGGFTVLGHRLFFTADDGMHGRELWVSDGTEAGTQLFADLVRGAEGSSPEAMAAVQGNLFFSAETPGEGREPWVSDGTAQGTVPLSALALGALASEPKDWMRSGWDLFFTGDDGKKGRLLWALPFRPEGKCSPQRK